MCSSDLGLRPFITFHGYIDRVSLRNLIDWLEIPIYEPKDLELQPDDKIIVVDGCIGERNVIDFPGIEVGVIDHHQVKPNDVVQFVVMNTGKIDHEFSIGSVSEQLEHREMMKKMGNHAHDSGSTVTVKPGKAKQMLWHFHGDNNVEFACNILGHAEAGMVKALTL